MSSEALSLQQLSERRNRIYSHFVLRRPGRWCLPLALRLGLNPNQVTAGALLVTVAGMVLLAIGGLAFSIAGIVAVHAGIVLDNLDGDLARHTGTTSRKGEFLDALMGYIYGGFVLLSVGIGAARTPDFGYEWMSGFVDFEPEMFINVGLLAGFLFFAARLISLRYRRIFERSIGEGSTNARRIALNIFDFLPLLLAVGVVTRSLSVVLLAYAMFHLASLVAISITSYKRAGSGQTT